MKEENLKDFEKIAIETARGSFPAQRERRKYNFPEEFYIYHVPKEFTFVFGSVYRMDVKNKCLIISDLEKTV